MSSDGLFTDESLDLEQLRRSTRERRQSQYFGYSGSDGQAEGHNEMAVAQVTDRGKERSTMTPSLVIKLPSPRFAPHDPFQFPPYREVQIPHINAEKKRGITSLTDNAQVFDKSEPVLAAEPTKKRQRLSPTMPQSTQEDEGHPKPRGQPEVWAEVNDIQQVSAETLANNLIQGRQALCESLPYYQSFHSAAYAWGSSSGFAGYVYSYLLDNDNEEYGYMDEKVVITRL